jgi:two-component system, OmpR family, response regulator MprA
MNHPEPPPYRVLIAEDDRAVRDALTRVLRVEGYDVDAATDGAVALNRIAEARPDIAVLDVMMPNVDGLSVCRTLRQRGDRLPILLLTARHEIRDRVDGLDAGADDYLPKPFAIDELLARVRALLRRADSATPGDVLSVADLVVDRAGRQVTRAGQPIELTKTEYELLELLIANAGVVLSRDLIYERIWGFSFETTSKTLDVYIGYLRRKVDPPELSPLIQTVRGVGYVLRPLGG